MVRRTLLRVSAFDLDLPRASESQDHEDEPPFTRLVLSSPSTATSANDELASEYERLRLEGYQKSGEIIGRLEDGMKSRNSHTGLPVDWYPSPR